MQWDNSLNAGFTSGEPWLPVNRVDGDDVASQSNDDASMFALYRRLLALRRSEPAFVTGSIEHVEVMGDVLIYERVLAGRRFVVALNMSDSNATIARAAGSIVLSTRQDRDKETFAGDAFHLHANEAVIVAAS